MFFRSNIHTSTITQGFYRADAPHVAVAAKDESQRQERKHEASHGYTASLQSAVVVNVKASGYVKPDSTKDARGKEVWPAGLASEEVAHNG